MWLLPQGPLTAASIRAAAAAAAAATLLRCAGPLPRQHCCSRSCAQPRRPLFQQPLVQPAAPSVVVQQPLPPHLFQQLLVQLTVAHTLQEQEEQQEQLRMPPSEQPGGAAQGAPDRLPCNT